MKVTGQNSTGRQADRSILAGAGDRQVDGAGGETVGHARASDWEAARRFRSGIKSTERTAPAVTASTLAVVRTEGPRSLSRSFFTPDGERTPSAVAITTSDTECFSIHSAKSIASVLPTTRPELPTVLRADDMAKAFAVLVSDLLNSLKLGDRETVLVDLANRLDGRGRVVGGNASAKLLGGIGRALMALE